jgi:chromosome segregation protein
MFLKSIEVRGFKSFADKTELQFKKGVTAVVGPNGSGKSNVSDAVRWVLGEQSVKNLRGSKMEDVIFAGTQFRKPVGLAQVSLILDNSDNELNIEYSDVKVTRRLYRSGESEYYLNSTKCRLKDIQELFMDTGIGKEGYSIIGQGKIDAILNGKPEDRRKLLEEAAGIVKYKSRKEEAEKKLENTEQNLIRINDILSTYEERINPLKEEMEKAKKFLQLSDDLKTKEINLVLDSLDNIHDKIKSVGNQIDSIEKEIQHKNEQKNKYKEQSDYWNKELEKFDLQTNEEKKRYYNSKSQYQSVLAEVNLINEKVRNLSEIIEKTQVEVNDIKGKISKLKEVEEKEQTNLQASLAEGSKLEEQIIKLQKHIMMENSFISEEDDNLKRFKKEQVDISINITEKNNNLVIANKEIEDLKKKDIQLKQNVENYANALKINCNTKAALEKENKIVESKIQNGEQEILENKKQITSLRITLNKNEKNIKELNNEFSRVEASSKVLKNLSNEYEGYTKAVKKLMNHIKKGYVKEAEQKCCVLGEIITVEKKFETAIEIAMGSSISNVITDDEITAKELIRYLKERKMGRATFLPLNIIKGRKVFLKDEIKNSNGFIGIASDLLKFDKKFNNILEFVLGKVVVVDNMDNALYIAKKGNYSFKIVTLSGEVINPGGSLTGGSIYHKSNSIIGRKREIKELEQKKEALEVEIFNLNEKISSNIKLINEIDEINLNLMDEIHFEKVETAKIQTKLSAIEQEAVKLRSNLNEDKIKSENLQNKIKEDEEEIKILKSDIEALNNKQNNFESQISELEEKLRNKLDEINELKDKLTDLKIKKAQNDEILSSKSKEVERIKKEIEELKYKKENLKKEIVKSIESKEEFSNKIDQNEKKADEISQSISKLEGIFKENEIERLKIKDNIKKCMDNIEDISLMLNKCHKELHKYQLVLTKNEAEKETLFIKLNEEIGLTYAEAVDYKVQIEDIDKLRKEIVQIKNQISSLGVVNVGAIQEYEELKEKFTFMNGQRDDLIDAKEELLNVINEMTEKMKNVFKENFIVLRKNFSETFKELFKGGSADLILAEGDELTAKIDINVQPPGKKLQNINLMSGGEKVLSAIALLFAILKMKPTPFCILDEIEAALDDANVFRYAEFLKKFSHNIQFIVITHRKGTMEVSDVLYGITMEEKGISKVVSVDLTQEKYA